MTKVYTCERCTAQYILKEACFFIKDSKGNLNKMYSALSYKYCAECLPHYEEDAIKYSDLPSKKNIEKF